MDFDKGFIVSRENTQLDLFFNFIVNLGGPCAVFIQCKVELCNEYKFKSNMKRVYIHM